jgi:HPt (histidine-containing phosphotransfer) domain-containing protein
MPRKEVPSVATFADHEMITPPADLRKAVLQGASGSDDPVARAEAALAQLSNEFGEWMHAECERLDSARKEVRRIGMTKKTHDDLFRSAHDLKGEAATLGYPTVGPAADSLCRLMEHTPDMTRIPVTLIDQHVDAVRALVREHARKDFAQLASALTKTLRDVTDEFLRVENSDRPDYLESIFAPPLAP